MAASPSVVALEVLARAVADPTPRPLFGTKAKPGIVIGAGKAQKDAATFLETSGFIESTEMVEPKTRKTLYRVTAKGIDYALDNAEPVVLLREIKAAVEYLVSLRDRVESALKGLDEQRRILDSLSRRMTARPTQPATTPVASSREARTAWTSAAIDYVREFERSHPNQFCPLPSVFEHVAKPADASLGEFHDGIRRLAKEGSLRLHPYTRPLYTIEAEECALVAGQEIKYYAQFIAGGLGG